MGSLPLKNAASCKTYLHSLSQGEAAVLRAEALARTMLGCQPTDQAYHDWVADSVLDVRMQLEQCLLSPSASRSDVAQSRGHEGKVPLALESVLMSVLHAPVMQSLVTLHAQADATIHKQAKTHCYAGSKTLDSSLARLSGAEELLIGMDLSHASAALQRIDTECSCPLEMICAIAEADRRLADSAGRLRQSSDSEQAVSADDLLSTTIAAVIVAKPERLVSCLEYLKLFHSTGDWSGKTGFQVATLEAAAAYIEQLNRAFSTFSASGPAPRHSQEFMQALLEEDEPLTFANSSYALRMQAQHTSSPIQVPGPHKDKSASDLRYGHGMSLKQLIGEELMQRAASLQRTASLQRAASLHRTASGKLRAHTELTGAD
ncbi:hypothetical protein CVIRNUC_008599 [Coccomyxa viridis]|uniref:VPS9 domain-containing protein n=1 Tax=Coccomyxa viridis TaxID=1274662 RepID=A0AAV1IH94_9CHLO|nr:hypothetical protein CVIRNUC_008599 [Coccomyxa viridis]